MFDSQNFRDKMDALARRLEELNSLLGTPEVINKRAEYLKLSREQAELDPLVRAWQAYGKLASDLGQARQMADAESDAELRELAREETRQLETARDAAEHAAQDPAAAEGPERRQERDPRDPRRHRRRRGRAVRGRPLPHVHAVRRAAGLEARGDVAVGGHRRRLQGGRSSSSTARTCTAKMKFEAGVHRVQRVPATEAQGRIHTSTATVAVLPEAEEVDVKIDDKDLRDRRLPLERRRRPARQHDRLGRAHHAPADRHRRRLPGRALARSRTARRR